MTDSFTGELSTDVHGRELGDINVYGVDTLLAALMTMPRSNYSWDIICKKQGDKIIFDFHEEASILSQVSKLADRRQAVEAVMLRQTVM